MATEIKNIQVPDQWRPIGDYDSHRPLLYLCVTNLKPFSTVIEFGSGFGSTPLLRKYCEENSMTFYSFETDKEWAEKTGAEVIQDFANIELKHVDLLFVDGKPAEQRNQLIELHKETAQIIVVHDSEPSGEWCYKLSKVLSEFKYRIDYTFDDGSPWTTAVSNVTDVTQWINQP